MNIKDAKIVYMGTPEFAVPALEALHREGAHIGMVFTQPDKSRDRGKKVSSTPVKEKAQELGIEVIQPERLKEDRAAVEKLKNYKPDLIVVAAYGQILSREVLDIPRCGAVNIHGSLLPRWRGAAPIQHSVWTGDEKTGITLMKMEEGLDSGDMLAFEETEIGRKTSAELYEELADMGAKLLITKIEDILNNRIAGEKQDEAEASYAPMIFKSDGALNFSKSAEELERQIRAMNSAPGAYTHYRGVILKVWKAEVAKGRADMPEGSVVDTSEQGIDVAARGSILRMKEVQLAGKRRMPVSEFLKGNKIEIQEILGN